MNRLGLLLLLALVLPCSHGISALLPERLLFDESFEVGEGALSPYYWQPLEGSWLSAQRTTRVLRQESADVTAEGWALAMWANYSVVTKCLAEEGDGPWGVGLTAYNDGQGRSYRLRLGEGRLYLEKLEGNEVRVLADVEARSNRGKWFSLRLCLTNTPAETVLAGKLWGRTDEEPKEWAVEARDGRDPLRGGSLGLWTGNCAGRFSFLSAKHYDPQDDRTGDLLYGTDFTDTAQGRLPAFWRADGGLWTRDTLEKLPVLRQMVDQCGPMYDENASACLDWTGYTVSVSAIAHPGTAKWGVGLVAYCSSGGSNYRLRTLDNRAYLVKRGYDGRQENLAATAMPLKRGVWYNLKLAVDNQDGAVRLQSKVWPQEAPEPLGWQLSAYDRNARLRGGAPGLWCFGTAMDFDNFQVKTSPLSALNESLP